jgi:hypothetical protein
MVTIVTELSGSYFDLDAGSWSSDDRRAENFDKSSAELFVLLACDAGLLIGSIQHSGSAKTQKILVVRN